MSRWIRSMVDLAVDVATALFLEVGALVDDWRNDR